MADFIKEKQQVKDGELKQVDSLLPGKRKSYERKFY